MATQLANIKRKYENTEAGLVLQAKQWGYGEDTRRITVMEDDGTTRRYFWDSTRLADQTSTYGAALIGIDGITGVTPDGGSSGAAATLRAMLRGGLGIANLNFLSVAPNSNTRNLVQPSGDFYGLRLRNNAAQSNEILRVEDASGVRLAYVTPDGHWYTNHTRVGSANIIAVGNLDNTNAASHAQVIASVGGDSGGDAKFTAQVSGAGVMSIGIDNSDSDAAVLSMSTSLGTSNAQRWTSSGTTIPGTLGVTGAVTLSSTLQTLNDITIGNGTGGRNLNINGAANQYRGVEIRSGGVIRWYMYADINAESGSNAGSTWKLSAYDDAGTFIDSPISVVRAASGTLTISRPVSMSSTLGVTGIITATAGILINGGSVAASTIYSNGSDGLVLAGRVGSAYDFHILNGSLNTVMRVPTGTVTAQFLGAATIAGTLAVTGASSFGGNIIGTSSSGLTIRTDTSDGSDNKGLFLTPASAYSDSRGARIGITGNEYAGAPGFIDIAAGNVSGSTINVIPRANQDTAFMISDGGGAAFLTIHTTTGAKRANHGQLSYFASNVRVGHDVATSEPLLGVGGEIGFGGTKYQVSSPPTTPGDDIADVAASPSRIKIKYWTGTTWERWWVEVRPNTTVP